jgi:hypothetical protein
MENGSIFPVMKVTDMVIKPARKSETNEVFTLFIFLVSNYPTERPAEGGSLEFEPSDCGLSWFSSVTLQPMLRSFLK